MLAGVVADVLSNVHQSVELVGGFMQCGRPQARGLAVAAGWRVDLNLFLWLVRLVGMHSLL